MAIVYLARDLKHDRQVAIKVMKPEIASSLGDDRFLREIQITAKLSHPNILTLYDSGALDGFLYYVMPFIQGESVGDLIEREKQLGIDEAVRIAREVAEALAHAHSYGLVHRDIKPDNIMLQSGHAIVADFGISRAVSEAGGDKLTQTGMAVGTPAYMAPEQAAGNPDVDGRADVYSLGCLLYEMLIGQIPFTGPNPQAIMARHTMDQLTPPSIMRDTIPHELEDIIFCAMAKLPADRFKTAHELVEALQAFESGSAPKVRKSVYTSAARTGVFVASQQPAWRKLLVPILVGVGVAVAGFIGFQMQSDAGAVSECGDVGCRTVAVLYFDDLSDDSSLGLVADGLTESLIDRLSAIGELSVISRNGVEQFKGTGIGIDSIVDALGAGTVIRGSVEPDGSGFRVAARLIDGASRSDTGNRVSFRVDNADVLTARDSVAGEVERQLRLWLGQEIQSREQRAEASSGAAWLLVQRAQRSRAEAEELDDADDRAGALESLSAADSLLALAEIEDPDWLEPVIARGWVAHRTARWLPREDRAAVADSGLARVDGAIARFGSAPKILEIRGHLRHLRWQVDPSRNSQQARLMLTSARDDLVAATQGDRSLARAFLELRGVYYNLDDPDAGLRAAQSAMEADAFLVNADRIMDGLFWGYLDNQVFIPAERWCNEGAQRFGNQPVFTVCRLWLLATPATASVGPDEVSRAWELVGTLDSLLSGDRYDPWLIEAEMATGGILARAGLVDSARVLFEGARSRLTPENDPEGTLLTVEAYMRTHAKDYDESIDLLKRYVLNSPDHGFEENAGTQWYWRELQQSPRWSEITGGR